MRHEELNEEERAEWEALISKAYFALDDAQIEAYEKRQASVQTRLERLRKKGLRPVFYLLPRVKRVLLEYARTYRLKEAIEKVDGWDDEIQTARDAEPDVRLVMDYVQMRRRQRHEMENGEMLDDARDAAGQILREGDEGKRTKMATFALERLDRKGFGQDDVSKEEGGGSNRTVYRVSNVNIGQLTVGGGGLFGGKLDLTPVGAKDDAVDVESESRPVAALPIGDE